MKKLICILLVLSITFCLFVPCGASYYNNKYPIIIINGHSTDLYNIQGKQVWELDDVTNDVDTSSVASSVANVMLPFVIQGLLFNKWDAYYNAFEKEIGELFSDLQLDENGDVANGTTISQKDVETNKTSMNTDFKARNGHFTYGEYRFYFDWRLDPWEIADQLHEYITSLIKATNCKKVCLQGRCLGGSFLMAYIAKYGYDLIQGVGFDAVTVKGSEPYSESITGNSDVNGDALMRYLEDQIGFNGLQIDEMLLATLNLLNKSGISKNLIKSFETLFYDKLKTELIGRIATTCFGTWPGYWAIVSQEDYESAKKYIFGEKGSEKYKKYEGLINKIDRYDEKVRKQTDDLLYEMYNNNVNLCIIAKYGSQTIPISESSISQVGEEMVSLNHASFGATTAKSVYETLPEKYIENKILDGKGDYISADKQVDTSTCLFPDSTWIIKGVAHKSWTKAECTLMYEVLGADERITIHNSSLSQFLVLQNPNDGSKLVPMDESNMDVTNWDADDETDNPSSLTGKISALVKALIDFVKPILNILKGKLLTGDTTQTT